MIKAFAHKIIASFLVIMLFAHNINTLTIIGDFIINQDFIAKTLCIQKENQQGCHGKCHLTKQLAENNPDSNNQLPSQENKRLELDIYCFFISDILDIHSNKFVLPRVHLFHKTSKTVKTLLEVETPPPMFS
ncbi:hypothetical protein [Flavivirga rizhaonensis]|uniref:Uncharacterized protein n=1 Tax=Flavivirga rizhaonensis TaxID=2559571 RepID=A0A4S1DVY9_9FLAO|nr:hypothetical protein [Flavivirga rizhaonensis]TGV02341.1 hypothetical protein EM932_11410 [Flavivirga rizhaonensis]